MRFITDWSKKRQLHGNAVVDEIPIVLTARKSLGEEKNAELLEALKNTAAQFGANS